MADDVYNIHTDYFEGPLDLMLHLIRKNKMNIMDVKLSEITSEYLYYLESQTGINPSREGDFLMTASTLIYIKSRSLLPRPEVLQEESPERQLINTLIEYDKIQKISSMLKELEDNELVLWRREEVTENFAHKEFELKEVTSFQLAEVFMNLVKKREKEEFLYIETKHYSIQDKRDEILRLLDEKGYIDFNEYVEELDTIEEVLVSFFTLLEMVKRRLVVATQKKLFDSISVWKNIETDDGDEQVQ